MEWSDADRVATFRGDVKAVQGTMTLYADVLKVHVSGETNQAPPADTAGTGGSDAPPRPAVAVWPMPRARSRRSRPRATSRSSPRMKAPGAAWESMTYHAASSPSPARSS
ncbi:LptA/OstA family protein [Tistrella bauzanensis]